MTRARVLTGSAEARDVARRVVDEVLDRPREDFKLRADVLKMRSEMAAHKPAKGPLDVKLLRGGLVDLEFLVHFLQLRERIGLHPELLAALAELESAGLVGPELGEHLKLLSRVLVGSRLLAPDLAVPAGAAAQVLAHQTGTADMPALLRAIDEARHGVAREWQGAFGEALAIEPEEETAHEKAGFGGRDA